MTTTTTFNDTSLSDQPFVLDLIVQQRTTWSRRLRLYDTKARLVIPLAGKTFVGQIKELISGPVIASYVFNVDTVNNWFDVSLPVVTINALNPSIQYVHDWLYTEGGSVAKVMTGTLRAVPTVTTP